VIKRWSFAGFPGSHGTHEYFRHGGSIGNRSYPGRVFKGKRMAGHWGDERISIQNLEVVEVRADNNLLLVKGSVPGAERGVLLIRQAAKGRN
jgi:large subunit ribosomal protein L3